MKHKLQYILDNPHCLVSEFSYKETLDKQGVVFSVSMYLPYTKSEPINELENPCGEITLSKLQPCTLKMFDRLESQEDFKSAIRNQEFMVGSVDEAGRLSFSPMPTTHSSATDARKECARLAKAYPGKMYTFVRLQGAEIMPKPVNMVSI